MANKIKPITITEDNIGYVYGRIDKFFYNKNRTGFLAWHNFDCGFKRHISPMVSIDHKKCNVMRQYPSPIVIGTTFDSNNNHIIVLRLTAEDGDALRIGDKIAFCGNRIIYRTKCVWTKDHNFIYSVFQALPMTRENQHCLHETANIVEETMRAHLLRN